ncbi:hypothetical protein FXN61_44545 [Lentzea sp. PSKA42]|uniref:PrsW family intramembrane metalloprotease n=1 Tax=Lentzea indica TaxID=2604800 RepID=A0ABX1FXX4_9PSEU|nr:hypothetical protein [Lentzea indica]NKE63416.1 hypothetical protein [Lentzea indica]
MTLDKLARWTGVLAGLFIGVPGAVEAVTGETAATSFVLGIAPALALPLLTALYLRQGGERCGAFGTVAYTVNIVGLGLFGGAAFTLNLALFFMDQPVLGGRPGSRCWAARWCSPSGRCCSGSPWCGHASIPRLPRWRTRWRCRCSRSPRRCRTPCSPAPSTSPRVRRSPGWPRR